MKLKLTLRRTPSPADLEVEVDGSVTVGALAHALAASDPSGASPVPAKPSLTVEGVAQAATTVDPHLTVAEAGLGSGQYVSVVPARSSSTSAAVLNVESGPDAGRSFELSRGLNTIGRRKGSDVRLTDPMVSQIHAKVIVGDTVEIVDDNSSNGILVGSDRVQRVVLRPGDTVTLGDSVISVVARQASGTEAGFVSGGVLEFNRSPRVDPIWEGPEFEAPELPQMKDPQRFPYITAVVPIMMAGVMYLALPNSGVFLIFMAMSPLMIVGGYFENKRAAKSQLEADTRLFRENLAQLVVELRQTQEAERIGRNAEHPSTSAVVTAVRQLDPLVWTRRPEHDSFLGLRLGLGAQPSRITVEVQKARTSLVELQKERDAALRAFEVVDQVPIVAELRSCGSVGVSGPRELRMDIARGLVAQLVGLHSPAELALVSFASPQSAPDWDWIKWLPHVGGDHHPLRAPPLASTAPACLALVSELADLIASRSGEEGGRAEGPPPLPAVLVLVEDDAPVERSALVGLMERGREHGVHIIWSAPRTADVPAAARTFLEVDGVQGAATGKVIEAERVQSVVVEPLDRGGAEWLARRLSPVVDAGSKVDDSSDVPAAVSFLTELGMGTADAPEFVVERWRESNSIHEPGVRRPLKRDNTLRAFVGRSAVDPVYLDLRTQGPHALVGGTTGAGKSEFLQTWVLAMAASHSPQRVTFLFVDYKGGAAFADCIALPHSVGLVTDLSPHLVQRALVSLNAELRHRERLLNRKKAKDLLELERRGDPACPPSLVIVVDEFAALVQEVPEFVDGVVNVAQRGRSLGLHLILATQRPAGVIKDNLRANTNLRVALRMADEEDSKDVVGTPLAGTFDPAIPGRGVVKTGPGRLALFQSGYVGGWTTGEEPPPRLRITTLAFAPAEEWEPPEPATEVPEEAELGPNDIRRVVVNVGAAAAAAGIEPPRKPWLPELAHAYGLEKLPNQRRDGRIVFGVADLPASQAQDTVAFEPDVDGNIAVFGTGGTGKSAFLRTLAISAGFTARSGPCFVYGLDFGSRGLTMLEGLPHVGAVIGADDAERTARLITTLRETIDERAVRYAAVNAGTLEEYRTLANQPDEPRILLVLDGFAAFRTAYETGLATRVLDQLVSVAVDGRPVGVHLALSADRIGAIPAALAGSIQRRLALRLSNDMDEAMLDVPRDGFGDITPPGRGFLGGTEVQVAVLSGSPDVAEQARSVQELAASMQRAGATAAPGVERLADDIAWDALPPATDGRPTLGIADDTLGPVPYEPSGTILVTGPAGSGRTSTVRTMVAGLKAARPALERIYFGSHRSPLAGDEWERAAVTMPEVASLAEDLVADWGGEVADAASVVVVIDGLGEFVNSDADYALQDVLKACRTLGICVIADGESSDIGGSWPLLQAIKAQRHGFVLQPDQADGDTIFRTPFPRVSRADFPPGRGFYVRGGKARRVQVARVSEAPAR